MPRFRRSTAQEAAVALTLAATVACGSLKTASDAPTDVESLGNSPGGAEAGPSSSGDGGTSPTRDPGTGTGALPSGYCCTSDADCRYHACVDVGGQRMCLDECSHPRGCRTRDVTAPFTCDAEDSSYLGGRCRPPAGFACLPPAAFVRGTRTAGQCCARTGDGTAGEECEGNLCVGRGDGPLVCSQWCARPSDCPSPLVCNLDTNTCDPATDTYTCD